MVVFISIGGFKKEKYSEIQGCDCLIGNFGLLDNKLMIYAKVREFMCLNYEENVDICWWEEYIFCETHKISIATTVNKILQ